MQPDTDPKFFKSISDFKKWLTKNHSKETFLWVGFYKHGEEKQRFLYSEAYDLALCFGWSIGIIKSLDSFTYKVRFLRRKAKSKWSYKNIKKFQEFKKKGLAHKAGLAAFENRDKEGSEEKVAEFTQKQIKKFKANKKAWEFLSSQTNSYRHYMAAWVNGAKREETREKRFNELVSDSARGSKLQRIVDAVNKIENRHEPGKKPIEKAKNIGAVSGAELRSIGIETVEQLQKAGWEETFYNLCEKYPERANLNMLNALIGAVENVDWRKLSPTLKAQAKGFLNSVKRDLGL
jgi:uncharacterized protein YdeI (YjbR/CyaY-like superfamily)